MQDTDRIADNLIAERDVNIERLRQAAKASSDCHQVEKDVAERMDTDQQAKASPDLWVVIGMVAQWLIEQFGANLGISYESVASWASTISEMTKDTDGGSMTVVAALLYGAGKLGYRRYKNR